MHPKNDLSPKKLLLEQIRVIKLLYKKGHDLDDICYNASLDIDSVLEIINKFKYKKKKLNNIFENQSEKKVNRKVRIQVREKLKEKFFPCSTDNFSHSYYTYWKENQKRQEEVKNSCKHNQSHIRCSLCSKVLADATDIYNSKKK